MTTEQPRRPSGCAILVAIFGWAVICGIIFILGSALFFSGDDGDSIPDVPVTNSLLIVYETDPGGNNPMTIDQRFIIDSVKIRDWCETNGVDFLALDTDQTDLNNLPDKWLELQQPLQSVTKPAWALSFGGRTTAAPLPPNTDAALSILEGR